MTWVGLDYNYRIRSSVILPLIVVSGLKFEAQMVQGQGIHALYGLHRPKLRAQIEAAARAGAAGILSFGTAGGLSPEVRPGDAVIARRVLCAEGSYDAETAWSAHLLHRLSSLSWPGLIRPSSKKAQTNYDDLDGRVEPGHDVGQVANNSLRVHSAALWGADTPAATAQDKAKLFAQTGALAVDMESHVAAEIAHRQGIPFAALRVVLDDAQTMLPPAALAGMKPDGSTHIAGVLASLIKNPRQLPRLMALARDHNTAKNTLLRSSQALRSGGLFGLFDVG